jgi:hypothetical protein
MSRNLQNTTPFYGSYKLYTQEFYYSFLTLVSTQSSHRALYWGSSVPMWHNYTYLCIHIELQDVILSLFLSDYRVGLNWYLDLLKT